MPFNDDLPTLQVPEDKYLVYLLFQFFKDRRYLDIDPSIDQDSLLGGVSNSVHLIQSSRSNNYAFDHRHSFQCNGASSNLYAARTHSSRSVVCSEILGPSDHSNWIGDAVSVIHRHSLCQIHEYLADKKCSKINRRSTSGLVIECRQG
jgi:hypothetical protein